MSHKIAQQILYTEIVYYNDDGNEVARERQHDDHLWDDNGPEELTDTEREDYL